MKTLGKSFIIKQLKPQKQSLKIFYCQNYDIMISVLDRIQYSIVCRLRNKIEELRKGAKRPKCNSDFISKIGVRSNTAHPTSSHGLTFV